MRAPKNDHEQALHVSSVDISSVGCLGGFSRKDESKNSYMCHGSLHFIALDIQLITQALVFRARWKCAQLIFECHL